MSQKLTLTRNFFHAHPELSGEEFNTYSKIRNILNELNIEIIEKFSAPNVVAILKGMQRGPTIAIRADMDALPIREENNVPYRSLIPGIMHACGHDAHITMLLGAAEILSKRIKELNGNIKLIFQSSEEKSPGGAYSLVQENVLEAPKVDAICALHVQGHIPCGRLAIYQGNFMAASDDIFISVHGKSCHAAHPERGIDAILVSVQIFTALQSIISRLKSPTIPAVLSICTIGGGAKNNVIADSVQMTGTLRTFDENWRELLKKHIQKVACGIAQSYGASCNVEFVPGYPSVNNDRHLCEKLRESASKIIGTDNVFSPNFPSTGSDDFAWYQKQCPGIIAHIGCGNSKLGISASIHTPCFDIDPDVLPIGASIIAQFAYDFLNKAD